MNKVLFCGAGYGAGNIGDDAILNGLLISARRYLRKDTKYGALTFNPDFTKKTIEIDEVFYFEAGLDVAFKWATHIVLGGASLLSKDSIAYCIYLIAKANKIGKPICMLAVGTSIEPEESQKMQLIEYIGSLEMITLRSEADRERVIGWGLHPDKLYVCADGAFAIKYEDAISNSSDIIGINLVHEGLVEANSYIDTITEFLSNRYTKVDPYFICGEIRQEERYDYVILKQLYEQFGGDFFYQYVPYQDFLKELAKCRLVVTMRMHIMIFCSLIGVPCIPLIREPKLQLMFDSLGLKVSLPLSFSFVDLKRVVNTILKNPKLGLPDPKKLAALKERSLKNGKMLCTWMRKEL